MLDPTISIYSTRGVQGVVVKFRDSNPVKRYGRPKITGPTTGPEAPTRLCHSSDPGVESFDRPRFGLRSSTGTTYPHEGALCGPDMPLPSFGGSILIRRPHPSLPHPAGAPPPPPPPPPGCCPGRAEAGLGSVSAVPVVVGE